MGIQRWKTYAGIFDGRIKGEYLILFAIRKKYKSLHSCIHESEGFCVFVIIVPYSLSSPQ